MDEIVLKVKCGDIYSRFNALACENGILNIDLATLRRKIRFSFKISPETDYNLRYTDNDGDEISLVEDSDLHEALKIGLNPLRITVELKDVKTTENDKDEKSTKDNNVKPITQTLADMFSKIRERCAPIVSTLAFLASNCDIKLEIKSKDPLSVSSSYDFKLVINPKDERDRSKCPMCGCTSYDFEVVICPTVKDPSKCPHCGCSNSDKKSSNDNISTGDSKAANNVCENVAVKNNVNLDFEYKLKEYEAMVCDVNVGDVFVFSPNDDFIKTWKLVNSGKQPWPLNTKLVWFGGDQMSNETSVVVKMPWKGLGRDEVVKVSIKMKAPEKLGHYISHWRMKLPSGEFFGEPIWVIIRVTDKPERLKEAGLKSVLDMWVSKDANYTAGLNKA